MQLYKCIILGHALTHVRVSHDCDITRQSVQWENECDTKQSVKCVIVKAAMRKRVTECKTFRAHNAVVWICGGELIYYNNNKKKVRIIFSYSQSISSPLLTNVGYPKILMRSYTLCISFDMS